MNIFNKVTLQSLKKNKARTIVTIIGIMLSTALICAVTTSFASVRNYAIGYYEYTEGSWHGMEKDADKALYDTIKASDKVRNSGAVSYIGYAGSDSVNDYKPYIYVAGIEESEDGLIPVHLTSGRMPENSSEILLPDHLYENGDVVYTEGSKLSLGIGDRKVDKEKLAELGGDVFQQLNEAYSGMLDEMKLDQEIPYIAVDDDEGKAITAEYLDVRETREYTVVGFYKRPGFEDYYAPGYTALTVPDAYTDDTQMTLYYSMNTPDDIYDFMEENDLNGKTHTDVLMFKGVSKYNSFYSLVYGLASVVIGLIVFGSIMLIYNAFSISVADRTKQFGLLASVGATKKQLRKMVRFEAIAVSIIGIPLGLLLGIVGMWVTFLAIGSKFAVFAGNDYPEPMRICVSPVAIGAACLIGFITIMLSAWIPSVRATRISAVEAIRQNSDIKQKKYIKTPKIIYKLFGISGILAHKYFKRSKKKYRATIISLFLSIVLFISAYSFTAYLVSAIADANNNFGMDYVLTLYNPDGVEESGIDPYEVLADIKNTEHITKASFNARNYLPYIYVNKDDLRSEVLEGESAGLEEIDAYGTQREGYLNFDIEEYIIDDDEFRELLKQYGLSESEFMDKSSPKGIIVDSTLAFDSESGRMVRTKFFAKDEFDLVYSSFDSVKGYFFSHVLDDGNVVYVNEKDVNDTKLIPIEECSKDRTLNIGKVIDERPYFVTSYSNAVIYPYSCIKEVIDDAQLYYYDFAIKSDDTKAGYESLKETFKEKGISDEEFWNYAAGVESERNMVVIIKVFAYGFIVLISLIAAANVFNTITTNINLRRREFAMLKSVGMTAKSMRKMLNFECLLYGSKALLYGLPTSIGVTYLIYLSINEGIDTPFFVPWIAVLIAVMSVFIVVFATMMYSMGKIKKDNPIDALKNENI